jgi:hypothetical protein
LYLKRREALEGDGDGAAVFYDDKAAHALKERSFSSSFRDFDAAEKGVVQ